MFLKGWGRKEQPEVRKGTFPDLLSFRKKGTPGKTEKRYPQHRLKKAVRALQAEEELAVRGRPQIFAGKSHVAPKVDRDRQKGGEKATGGKGREMVPHGRTSDPD